MPGKYEAEIKAPEVMVADCGLRGVVGAGLVAVVLVYLWIFAREIYKFKLRVYELSQGIGGGNIPTGGCHLNNIMLIFANLVEKFLDYKYSSRACPMDMESLLSNDLYW